MMKIKRFYFIISGLFAHIIPIFLLVIIAKYFDLTANQFVYRLTEKVGIQSSVVDNFFLNNEFDFPPQYHAPVVFNKKVRIIPQIQRLVSRELTPADYSKSALKEFYPCNGQQLLALMACGVFSQDQTSLDKAKLKMLNFKVVQPNASGHYANGWRLAFAYDSLKTLVNFSIEEKEKINQQLVSALNGYLVLLSSDNPSMWHGRTTLTSQAMLTLLALDNAEKYSSKVVPHFYSMVDSLAMTEAWPEGYNYWINSRAFYVVLALSGYLNGIQNNEWHEKIARLVERIGMWHIHSTRPDWKIEPLGDEGPRVDLKDESRRVVDIIAQVTQQKIFLDYSNKLGSLHGKESYHASYRWGWVLFYPVKQSVKSSELPVMAIFGEKHYGQAYVRESWNKNATFLSYRAGGAFSHHGHYDNGHLSLFKSAPLLVNSSVPGKYFADNRLNYGIRTIAKNSLLIQKKGEQVHIGINRRNDIADGGQRITMPLGSAITSVSDWFQKKSDKPVLAGGSIRLSDHDGEYSYIKSELTKAYNSAWYDENSSGGKVNEVSREFVYLHTEDTLIIKDTIKTNAENQVKVVFHTVNKPTVDNESPLKGELGNGISTSSDKVIYTQNGEGFLTSELIGDIADVRLIGGPDYKFYVEVDGDDSDLDGENFFNGLTEQQVSDAPSWRFEVNGVKQSALEFITVHRPSLGSYSSETTKTLTLKSGLKAYALKGTVVVFSDELLTSDELDELPTQKIVLCGLKLKKGACKIYRPTTSLGAKH